MKGVYKFYWNCGRSGSLEGIFVADSEEVASAVGKKVYFGEVLGKHSEVYGALEEGDLTLITEEQNIVELFETHDIQSGWNPLEYISDSEEEGEQ